MIFICHFPAEKYKKIQFRVLCVFQKANSVIQRFYFYHYNGNRYELVRYEVYNTFKFELRDRQLLKKSLK